MADETIPTAAPAAPAPTPAPVVAAAEPAAAAPTAPPAIAPAAVAPVAAAPVLGVVAATGCAAWRAAKWAGLKTWAGAEWAAVKARDWSAMAWEAVDGVKTLLVALLAGAVGLADSLNGIDLSGLLAKVLPDGSTLKVGDVITLMAVLMALLRLVTNGSVFKSWRTKSAGGVDEPAA